MSENSSVLITLPKEKMEAISKRAEELGVATGRVASCLLLHGRGIDALPSVYLEEPRCCIKQE